MPLLTILCGPPGSGKSTLATDLIENDGDHGAATEYVNQDSQGKGGHWDIFLRAVSERNHIIVDRMGFNRQQRDKYLAHARLNGYRTRILVLHQPYQVCLERIRNRFGKHETIHDEKGARAALGTFFGQYERPQDGEADEIKFIYPEGPKLKAIYSDLDGTLCDVSHRRHYVRPEEGKKKDWASFFREIPNDTVNKPVLAILERFCEDYKIVFCSGRSTNDKKATVEWLDKHVSFPYDLFMRDRSDSRMDAIVKEILLDFEILTRYEIFFCLDDRDQVVKMLRKRGQIVLQVAEGDF